METQSVWSLKIDDENQILCSIAVSMNLNQDLLKHSVFKQQARFQQCIYSSKNLLDPKDLHSSQGTDCTTRRNVTNGGGEGTEGKGFAQDTVLGSTDYSYRGKERQQRQDGTGLILPSWTEGSITCSISRQVYDYYSVSYT